MRDVIDLFLFWPIATCLVLAVGCSPSIGTAQARELEINPDGAWCWFQDERALIVGDQLVVASITGQGDVQATVLNLREGKTSRTTLKEDFDSDDHNVPGMVLLEDGRVMAFYCRHSRETVMYYRLSEPGDATSWGPEQSYSGGVGPGQNFTYANPFQLSEEGGRIYNFWRGIDFNPTFATSDDLGQTWSEAANFLYWKKQQRPYVKYAANGRNTIHFAFTEGHPRSFDNNIFHGYYRAGSFYRSDGTAVKKLSDGPLTPEEATQVYAVEQEDGTGRGWIWDLALDENENPVMVYSTRVDSDDLRYRYARWNSEQGQWVEQQIAFGGSRLYRGEEDYAGGISIDPDNVDVVYLSSNVNIEDGSPNSSGRYEIHRGDTSDQGRTWSWTALTENSEKDNLRPFIPANHPGDTFVLWMRGDYRTYLDYETAIVLRTDAGIPTGSGVEERPLTGGRGESTRAR